jgi:hypothetical protein
MKFKIPSLAAIELGRHTEDSTDIELCGLEELGKKSSQFNNLIKAHNLTSNNLFINALGLDTKTLYYIELYHDNNIAISETGVGYVYERNGKILLRRTLPLYKSYNGKDMFPSHKIQNLRCHPDDLIVVYAYVPKVFTELLIEPNYIVSSSAPFIPTAVAVDNDSIVGRLEGNLDSLPLDSLGNNKSFQKSIMNAITSTTKQLLLKTTALCVNMLQLKPVTSSVEKEGALRYNKNSKSVEYYNGEHWRTLISDRSPE